MVDAHVTVVALGQDCTRHKEGTRGAGKQKLRQGILKYYHMGGRRARSVLCPMNGDE